MKTTAYTEIICGNYCKYYKAGKEDIHCGGYVFLKSSLTPAELGYLGLPAKKPLQNNQVPAHDEGLEGLLCKKCDFFMDGCDFADNRSGPPCGGYLLVKRLLG